MSKLFRRHLIKVSSFSGLFTIFKCFVRFSNSCVTRVLTRRKTLRNIVLLTQPRITLRTTGVRRATTGMWNRNAWLSVYWKGVRSNLQCDPTDNVNMFCNNTRAGDLRSKNPRSPCLMSLWGVYGGVGCWLFLVNYRVVTWKKNLTILLGNKCDKI